MQQKNSKKTVVFIGILILICAVVLLYLITPKKETKNDVSKSAGVLKQGDNVFPTIDSSVQVDFLVASEKKDVILKLNGIPTSTNNIDFELTYEDKKKGLQGAFGSIALNGEKSYEKRIKDALATCSSGKCVYHEIVGKIKVNLKFTGSYGDKIFEKEYAIWSRDAIYLH